jgi:protocatechuate 3,4-dioxygenase beta subunit
MTRLFQVTLLVLLLGGCQEAVDAQQRTARKPEPVVGLPCEGCEAVFDGLPDTISSHARIAPAQEPGEALRVEGTVRDGQGNAVPGVIVYAYHTDVCGVYPPDERLRGRPAYHHGRLRGWAKTDAQGRYRFDTIRPAGYPDTDLPQHIHLHVIEPGRCTYYLDDLVFTDDPRLTPAQRRQAGTGRGGTGIVTPRRLETGGWQAVRDIVLGAAVPGYAGCTR